MDDVVDGGIMFLGYCTLALYTSDGVRDFRLTVV
jgi:hypothetical protein